MADFAGSGIDYGALTGQEFYLNKGQFEYIAKDYNDMQQALKTITDNQKTLSDNQDALNKQITVIVGKQGDLQKSIDGLSTAIGKLPHVDYSKQLDTITQTLDTAGGSTSDNTAALNNTFDAVTVLIGVCLGIAVAFSFIKGLRPSWMT